MNFLDATGEADTVVETLSREAVPSLEGYGSNGRMEARWSLDRCVGCRGTRAHMGSGAERAGSEEQNKPQGRKQVRVQGDGEAMQRITQSCTSFQ